MRSAPDRIWVVALLLCACHSAPFAQCLSDLECGLCEQCRNGACVATPDHCRAGLVVSPERLILGPTAEGTRSGSGRVVVTAAGASVRALAAELKGGAGAIIVERDECTGRNLDLGSACSVDLAIEPPSITQYDAILSLKAADVLPEQVPIEGLGVAPAELSISPRRLDFGAPVAGGTSRGELVVTNLGPLPLMLTRARFDGPDAALFSAAGCIGMLPPSANCLLQVDFEPQIPSGQRSSTLVVEAEGGIVALAEVMGGSATGPQFETLRSRVGLPLTSVGGQATETRIAFRNGGDRPTGSLKANLTGPERDDFAASGCTQRIAPSGSCEVRVVFAPKAAGWRNAILSLSSTSGDSASVELLGEGLAPTEPSARPISIDLGEVSVGKTSPAVYYELETSPGVPVGSPRLTGPDASEFLLVPNGGYQGGPPGVVFRPTTPGPKTAALDFGLLMLPVAGMGLDSTSIDFEPSVVRRLYSAPASEPISAVLRNTSAVATGTITVTPPASTEVRIERDRCSGVALPPGGSCAIHLIIDARGAAGERFTRLEAIASPGGRVHFPISFGLWDPAASLDVTVVGNGSVDGSGFLCPGNCRRVVAAGTTVQLNAIPQPGSEFTGWSLGCGGSGACEIIVSGERYVEARFAPKPRLLQVARFGGGRVSSSPPGIECGSDCSETYVDGDRVTLTVTAQSADLFAGWRGDCVGIAPSCEVQMTGDRRVEANFSAPNRIFVSSTTVSPSEAELSTFADAECMRLAVGAGLGGIFRAWISTPGESAALRLLSEGPVPRGWVRTDGAPFADAFSELLNGRLYFPPLLTQHGLALPATTSAVTGSLPGGTRGLTCFGWHKRDAQYTSGASGAGAFGWTAITRAPCTESAHLYCLGVDRSVPLSIKREGSRLAFISASTWIPSSGIETADRLCQDEADGAGLLGEFLALLATTTAAPTSRLDREALPWARTDGMPLVTRSDELGRDLLTALDLEADGETYVGPELVWTGVNDDIAAAASAATSCVDWSSSDPHATGTTGNPMMTDDTWVGTASITSCAEPHRIYCFQR